MSRATAGEPAAPPAAPSPAGGTSPVAGGSVRRRSDEPLRIVSPAYVTTAWLLLAGVIALFVGAFLLRVPVIVEGQGMLMAGGDVLGYAVLPESEGRLERLDVRIGSAVKKGDVIGRVSIPRLENEIETAELSLQDLRRKAQALADFHKQSLAAARALLDRQRTEAENREAALRERLERLDRARAGDADLVKRGFLSPRAADPVKTEREQAEDQLYVSRRQLTEAETNFTELVQRQRREALDADLQVRTQDRQLQALLARRSVEGVIVAPADGTISEVMVDLQQPVTRERRVATLTPSGAARPEGSGVVSAVLFVPAAQGKKLDLGMPARLLPAIYDEQQFGRIEGRVVNISPVAADEDTLMRVFKNQKLVRKLFENEAPYNVTVELQLDPRARSGLAWSSSRGPDRVLDAGTIVSGWVAYDRPRLLFLLLPAVKRWTESALVNLWELVDATPQQLRATP